ncbi:hypothetical protein [Synechococcus sp. PCC 6312]|uniref:hypothetical protein n=1 Tax=Synechococcus sp. (strain ATCC 27167 / PCC 6312) TaxID=195253 RepID=UPI00029EE78F|nr:hypothetical protein [Synechococcus sp. PCC 6312]AFY59761.1 hypothetical protein Syn6312_0536 [Synechococcus sp. PCC 6312]
MNKLFSALVLSGFVWMGSASLALSQSAPPPDLSLIGAEDANKLGLTPPQIKGIVQLQKQIHSNIEGILTPPQLQKFQASLSQGATTRDALKSADLNIRQKVRVKNVMEGAIAELKTILTPAQFAEIQAKLQ